MEEIVDLINKYGFPIVTAIGMGFIIKYVWEWCTGEVKPVIGEANATLIALIDRIRMLDNDLIRLNQKINTVLNIRVSDSQEKHSSNITEHEESKTKKSKEID